jgi:UDP-2,4-diacetamido-2,4,6-trideoxy-beta-L-altropyranose hydrolase
MPPSPESKTLLIRADAGGNLGTGHVMRMIALAQAWQDRGGSVTLAACQCPTALIQRLGSENIDFVQLTNHTFGGQIELAETIQLGKSLSSSWIVVDGYHFTSGYQQALQQSGFKVLAVDDYGHCETWYADLILNQNIYGAEFPYPHVDNNTEILRGPRFGLLRREFRKTQPTPKTTPGDLTKLLLSFGGVDPDNATGKILSALNTLGDRALSLRVLLGAGNTHREKLDKLACESPHNIEFFSNVIDMPAQYEWAEGIVGAGGTTCLEWLFFSLQAALVRVADNQNLVVDSLAEKGWALDLGWHGNLETERAARMLAGWLTSSGESNNSFQVDAWGPARVTALMDNRLWSRPAHIGDCELYFQWANDPTVRKNALGTGEISWEGHNGWFSSRLVSPDVRFLLFFDDKDRAVGQVRFERKSRPVWEIDISVDPASRGNRLGSQIMSLAMRTFRATETGAVLAIIKRSNPASLKIFQSLGFTEEPESDEHLAYLTA